MLLDSIDEVSKMEEKVTVTGEELGSGITFLLTRNIKKRSLKFTTHHKLHSEQKAVKAKSNHRSHLEILFKSLSPFYSESV